MATESVGSCVGSPPKLPVRGSSFREEKKNFPNSPDRPLYRKNDICYQCKQEGHWARDCPNKNKESPGSSPIKAFPNCRQKYPEFPCKYCGQPCVVRTSRTVLNPNRDFYTCPASSKCNMFQWCDEVGKIQPSGVKSPVKPVQQSGAAVSQNLKCTCGAGPCRVETKQNGPSKGRKYFTCYLKTGQGRCVHFEWCDGLGDNVEMKDPDFNFSTDEIESTGINNHVEIKEKEKEVVVPTVPPPPTALRTEHEAYDIGSGSFPIKRPNLLEGSPSKRTCIEESTSECIASASLNHYLNEEPKNPKMNKETVGNQEWMSESISSPILNHYLNEEQYNLKMNEETVGNQDGTNSGETPVPKSPPQSKREHHSLSSWFHCSPMKRLSLTEGNLRTPEKCVMCGEVGHGVTECASLAMTW